MSAVINTTALRAVFRREIGSLLGNPLGYIFILGFVIAAVVSLFWINGDAYLSRMVADLQPLATAMPWLLVVLLPALAMGTWAKERESGTEELLLTMPLSTLDAVLGKWLAIVAFFTIALACTLGNPLTIAWHGNPDWGGIAANYVGWWLAGSVAAALALLASVLVSQVSVAFVVGVILCVFVLRFDDISYWCLQFFGLAKAAPTSWFEPFHRGVISTGHVLGALAAAAAAIGLSVTLLASRRWRPSDKGTAWSQVLSLLFAVLVAVNIAGFANRSGVDIDTTAEGLSSLSKTSRAMISNLPSTVTIHAFVSADESLPVELVPRAQEVLNTLSAIQRASNGKVVVKTYRPVDAFTGDGPQAEKQFGITPRRAMTTRLSGNQEVDVFLSAAVTTGARTELIPYFEPGLSTEYELMIALRGVSVENKPVLGVAVTDLGMHGEPGNPMMGGRGEPEWEIVKEWRRLYDVRRVDLHSPVSSDIKALVVGQPSSLTQDEIVNLHQWVWNGGPTLLLEDPLPLFKGIGNGRGDLLPQEKKRNPNADPRMGGMDDGSGPAKGDLKPLMTSLGIDWQKDSVVWSSYVPSQEFRDMIRQMFLWSHVDTTPKASASAKDPTMLGVNDLFFAMPGELRPSPNAPAGLTITPLATVTRGMDWGTAISSEYLEPSWGPGGPSFRLRSADQRTLRSSGELTRLANLAVDVRGTMPAGYPVTRSVLANDASPSSTAATDRIAQQLPLGTNSAQPIHVIVVADVDWASDQFFGIYRNQGGQFDAQQFRFLQSLRNVQLSGNAVDVLMGNTDLIQVRARRPQPRLLTTVDLAQAKVASENRKARDKAKETFEKAKDDVQKRLEAAVEELRKRDDLDEATKTHRLEDLVARNAVIFQAEMEKLRIDQSLAERRAAAAQNQDIARVYFSLKLWPLFIPTAILLILAVIVFEVRRQGERTSIPQSRKRA